MPDNGTNPQLEQRQYPRRRIRMYGTASINGHDAFPVHSLNVCRNGLCLRPAKTVNGLSESNDPISEAIPGILGGGVVVRFELYPVEVRGRIARVSSHRREIAVFIDQTSDDQLWRSICVM